MYKKEKAKEDEEEFDLGNTNKGNEDEYNLDDGGEYNLYANKDEEYKFDDNDSDAEYNFEDEKKGDEFNVDSEGFNDFMTSVKQSATPNYGQAPYSTSVPSQPITNPPMSTNPTPMYAQSNYVPRPQFQPPPQIQPQIQPQPQTTSAPVNFFDNVNNGGDEFDDLFGDKPTASKPTPSPEYMTYNQPQIPSYSQPNDYYGTYQAPTTSINTQYNPYGQQAPQMGNMPSSASPFDEVHSSYSAIKPNPPGGNGLWY